MKPINPTQAISIFKSFYKLCFLAAMTIFLTSFFTSCNVDEIELQPNKVTARESSLQPRDTIFSDSIPASNSSTTSNGEIIPLIKGNNPPPPNP